jgi:hypothetical protein
MKASVVALFSFFVSLSITSISLAADLVELIESGKIHVEQVRGNGASSGASLDGVLVNSSGNILEIYVSLGSPVFFVNNDRGQNMIATQVVAQDGSYFYREGDQPFLSISPGERLRVTFVAYCADFDEDNPQSDHRLNVGTLPIHLDAIANAIHEFDQNNFNSDNTVAIQVALWLAQGVPASEIRDRFPFTAEDERIAQTIVQQIR